MYYISLFLSPIHSVNSSLPANKDVDNAYCVGGVEIDCIYIYALYVSHMLFNTNNNNSNYFTIP